jgi:hypothetical protein
MIHTPSRLPILPACSYCPDQAPSRRPYHRASLHGAGFVGRQEVLLLVPVALVFFLIDSIPVGVFLGETRFFTGDGVLCPLLAAERPRARCFFGVWCSKESRISTDSDSKLRASYPVPGLEFSAPASVSFVCWAVFDVGASTLPASNDGVLLSVVALKVLQVRGPDGLVTLPSCARISCDSNRPGESSQRFGLLLDASLPCLVSVLVFAESKHGRVLTSIVRCGTIVLQSFTVDSCVACVGNMTGFVEVPVRFHSGQSLWHMLS